MWLDNGCKQWAQEDMNEDRGNFQLCASVVCNSLKLMSIKFIQPKKYTIVTKENSHFVLGKIWVLFESRSGTDDITDPYVNYLSCISTHLVCMKEKAIEVQPTFVQSVPMSEL